MNSDATFMREAIALARKGEGKVEPNPLVGALVVRDGTIVGRGFHQRFGGPHAEILALRQAGARAKGADLFVTLEPCVEFPGKKTPACAPRVIRSGIKRLVVASTDPHPRVQGRGIAAAKKAGISVVTGVLSAENQSMNAAFFKCQSTGLPYVVSKWAMTLDGKIATRAGNSKWITSEFARSMGTVLRARLKAVLVGSGTVLADDPRLEEVTRIVLDSWGRTPVDSNLIRTARKWRTIVAVNPSCDEARVAALRKAGAEVHKFEVMDLAVILGRLASMGIDRVLIEGGGEVHASALEAGIVDEVFVFIAPIIVGGRGAKSPVGGSGKETIAEALKLKGSEIHTLPTGEVLVHGWMR